MTFTMATQNGSYSITGDNSASLTMLGEYDYHCCLVPTRHHVATFQQDFIQGCFERQANGTKKYCPNEAPSSTADGHLIYSKNVSSIPDGFPNPPVRHHQKMIAFPDVWNSNELHSRLRETHYFFIIAQNQPSCFLPPYVIPA